MGSAQKAFKGVVWSVIVNIVNALYGFIAAPLLIGYFGRSEYGIIALAGSVNAYMGLMDLGLSSTNVRFFSNWIAKGESVRVKQLMQTCTAFYGVVGIINALILITIYFFTDQIFNVTSEQDVVLKQMLLILSITALINWYTSCFGQLISATENVAWIQKRTLLTKMFMIVAVALTLLCKFSILQYFVSTIIASLMVLPLTIRKVKKEAPYISFMAKFNKDVFKEILPYSLGIFSFGFFQFSFQNLRTVILGMQGTIAQVTDYGVMGSLAGLVSMVGGVFISALLPSSSRVVANGDQIAFDRVAYQGTRFISIVLCFCSFGLMTIDSDLMMIYVGKDFMHLIPWLNLWLLALLASHNSAISSLILAGTKIKALSYTSAFSSIIGLLVCWSLVPYFGAGGVVIAYFIYCFSQLAFFYFYYWPVKMKINSWRIFSRSFMPFAIIGGALVSFLKLIPHFENHWTNITVYGVLFAISYILIVFCVLRKDDKHFILRLIKR